MTYAARLAADFAFAAQDREELPRKSHLLRYVAALNSEVTKKEFVAAAVIAGYHPNTAAIQFANSRKVSLSFDEPGLRMDKEGRLYYEHDSSAASAA